MPAALVLGRSVAERLGFAETDGLFSGAEESKMAVRVFPASESIESQLVLEIIGLGGDGFATIGSAGLGGSWGDHFLSHRRGNLGVGYFDDVNRQIWTE